VRTYVHLKFVWKIKVSTYDRLHILYFYIFYLPTYNYISVDIQIDRSVESGTVSTTYYTTVKIILLIKLLLPKK
jgi:hypothetical protein